MMTRAGRSRAGGAVHLARTRYGPQTRGQPGESLRRKATRLNLTTRGLFAAVAGLALVAAFSSTSAADWKADHDAGWKAYQEGRFDEAEKLLRAAEKEARTFGAKDPRLATTLDHMAWVLCAEGRSGDAEPVAKWALA